MASKIPPQLRLVELEDKRAQLKKQLQVVRTALPRAEWARNEDARKLLRQMRVVTVCLSQVRLRLADPEDYKHTKRKSYTTYKEQWQRYRRAYYAANKESVLRKQKIRYERDKAKILAAQSAYGKRKQAERNRDPKVQKERAEKKILRRQHMGEFMRARHAKRWAGHVSICTPERKKMWQQRYMAKPGKAEKKRAYAQQPEVKARKRERAREKEKLRWKSDPQFALSCSLRSRVRGALAGRGVTKQHRTAELIGCTIAEFKVHLERSFVPGMSWENRSEWHIDHKRPCVSFDLTDVEQQRLCFHYSNMQPLWKLDNLRKGIKMPDT